MQQQLARQRGRAGGGAGAAGKNSSGGAFGSVGGVSAPRTSSSSSSRPPPPRRKSRRGPCVIRATLDSTVHQLKSIIDPQQRREQNSGGGGGGDFCDANFPTDADGRTLHLGCRHGEVANRVLSVGSMDRALLIADQLQGCGPDGRLFQHLSGRGFLTVTGLYQGTPVSVITTLMGMPNMDFVVREARAVVRGEMAVVRMGTCGALRPPAALGSFMVASPGAVCVRRDPDAWTLADGRPRYTVSAPVAADAELVKLLLAACREQVGNDDGGDGAVVAGLNATADSFYSSQGRLGADFDDGNDGVIEQLLRAHPGLVSLEMETFHLLDLARCSARAANGGAARRVRAAAFCIAAAERYSNRFIPKALATARERQGGAAALAALVRCPLVGAVGADGRVVAGAGAGGGGQQQLAAAAAAEPPAPPGGYVWAPKAPPPARSNGNGKAAVPAGAGAAAAAAE